MKRKSILKSLVVIAAAFSTMLIFTACPLIEDLSKEKQILSFSFIAQGVSGVINESTKTIAVTVPAGTNVASLTPTIVISALATVNPGSGIANNFTNPVNYLVTAEDGSAATYTVTVIVGGGGTGSSEKKIISFNIVSPSTVGVINENAKTVELAVPTGTNLTSLTPTIVVSTGATVNPGSGVPNNFTNPVNYSVTAEDGSSVVYTVTVSASTDPTQLPSGIDENTTLPDLGLDIDYVVDGTFRVNGNALLTIEPGVTIMFKGTNGNIYVTENAGLRMVGTAAKPIILTGPVNNQNKGSWNKVVIKSKRADNEFEYVQFINGGSGTSSYNAVIEVYPGMLKMSNCLIDGGLKNGIECESNGELTVFENNTIRNCNEYPVYAYSNINNFPNIGSNNVFTGNGKNYVYVGGSGSPTEDMTINKLSIPYYLSAGLVVNDNITLTIAPGTTMLLGSEKYIDVRANAVFVAEGTASERITVKGFVDEKGYCRGLVFKSTRSGNKLNYCDFSCGGKATGYYSNNVVYFYPGIRCEMRNTTVSKSYFYGVAIENPNNLYLTHENVTFYDCEQGNVWYYNDGSVHPELP
ncbi:DUF5018 domain-containing protein [Bacteroidales bacterium OttesenSCG-928-L14]|nr:DUF5018 domain-containing protein [Bacteroidales bacterium OttesenSCG-928-L14]